MRSNRKRYWMRMFERLMDDVSELKSNIREEVETLYT